MDHSHALTELGFHTQSWWKDWWLWISLCSQSPPCCVLWKHEALLRLCNKSPGQTLQNLAASALDPPFLWEFLLNISPLTRRKEEQRSLCLVASLQALSKPAVVLLKSPWSRAVRVFSKSLPGWCWARERGRDCCTVHVRSQSPALTCGSRGAHSSRTETFRQGKNTSLFLHTEGHFVLGKQAQERTCLTSSPGQQKEGVTWDRSNTYSAWKWEGNVHSWWL